MYLIVYNNGGEVPNYKNHIIYEKSFHIRIDWIFNKGGFL